MVISNPFTFINLFKSDLIDLKGSNRKRITIELVIEYNQFTIDIEDLPKDFYIIEFVGNRNHLSENKVLNI